MNEKYRNIIRTLPHSMDVKADIRQLPTLNDSVSYIDGMDFELIKKSLYRAISCCVGSGLY